MEQITNIYTNRDNQEIIFTLVDEKTIKFTGYNSTYIRITEDNNSSKFKKDNPQREIIPTSIDFIGGPYIFLGMDASDFLFNKKITHLSDEYLDSDIKRIVVKIEIQGTETILIYEAKPIKKESKGIKKNTSLQTEY